MLVPLELPPGVFKNGTDLMAKDRWTDASLVRFYESSARPIGGWQSKADISPARVIRSMFGWRDNSGSRLAAFGSSSELYVLQTNGTVSDITPAGLTSGFESATINTGYGGDNYGEDAYGTPRDDAANYSEATVWSLDNWGENLVGCNAFDGRIYEWTGNPANPATVVSNAPTGCEGLVATEERFLFALGAGNDPRKIQWSDQEDNTTWTPLPTNQAGDIQLQTLGGVMQGLRTRGQTVLLTDVDAHTATFIGGSAVYSFERVGDACGVISRQAGVAADGTAYWMGQRGFFTYNGGAVEPIPSEVSDYVFTNINRDQASLIWSVTNAQFGEVWWFYPSEQSNEIDSYVIYNYREGHWNIGMLERTAGIDQGVFRYPTMVSTDGMAYDHEFGFNHGGETPYAESGPIMIGTGDRVMVVTDLIPDEETRGQVTVTLKTRFYPNGDEYEYGPYTIDAPTSVRVTGRQIRMRAEGVGNDDWRVGIMRVDAKEGARR